MLSLRATGFLLAELCTRFGFCLSPEDRAALLAGPPADATGFALAVLAAEGFADAPTEHVLAVIEQAYGNQLGTDT